MVCQVVNFQDLEIDVEVCAYLTGYLVIRKNNVRITECQMLEINW